MKRILVVLLIILLSGCTIDIKEYDEYWNDIEGKEYYNGDVWAGHSIYFYLDGNIAMCKYMRHGSGIPVLFEMDSEITFEDDYMIVQLLETTDFLTSIAEPVDVILYYEDGDIIWDDMVFEEADITCHDGC